MLVIILIGFLLLSTAFLSPAPRSISTGELVYIGLFCLTFFVFLSQLFLNSRPVRVPKSPLYVPMIVMFSLLILSSWQAIIVNNVNPYLWLRGFIPFLNYLIMLPLLCEVKHLRDLRVLIGFLLLSGFVVLARVALVVISARTFNPFFIRGALPSQAFQPHILAAFAFLMGYVTETVSKKRLGVLLLAMALLLMGIVLTLSRSLVLIAALITIFSVVRRTRPLTALLRLVAISGSLGVLLWLLRDTSVYMALASRFSRNIRTDARFEELIAVLREFEKHPLLGNGLGYQYSYYRSAINLRWEGGYTHNFITYVLLTTGLLGLVVLIWLFSAILLEVKISRRIIIKAKYQEIKAVFWGLTFCLFATGSYALFQTVFRTFAFSNIVSLVLAGIVTLRKIALETAIESGK